MSLEFFTPENRSPRFLVVVGLVQGLDPKSSGVDIPFAQESVGKRPTEVHPKCVFLFPIGL